MFHQNRQNNEFQLKSKEIISLGLIAQNTSLTALGFSDILGLEEKEVIRTWLGRLVDLQLVKSRGKTKGTTYFVESSLLIRHNPPPGLALGLGVSWSGEFKNFQIIHMLLTQPKKNSVMSTTTMNEVPAVVRGSADAVKEKTAPAFDVDKEYTFSMRSFRFRNG